MKGLLYKDISLLFSVGKLYFVFIAVLVVLGFFCSATNLLSLYAVVFFSTLGPTTIAYDERDRWDIYSNLLPVTRGQYVSAKYMLTLILSFGIVIISLLPYLIKQGFNSEFSVLVPVYIIMGIIYPAATFPVMFKYGYSKGKIIVIIFAGILGALAPISSNSEFLKKLPAEGNVIIAAAAACAIVLYVVSWLISVAVYKKREF